MAWWWPAGWRGQAGAIVGETAAGAGNRPSEILALRADTAARASAQPPGAGRGGAWRRLRPTRSRPRRAAPARCRHGSARRSAPPASPGQGPKPAVQKSRSTLAAGTILQSSSQRGRIRSSKVEDAVRGTLRRAVSADGVQAFPAGTAVSGVVTAVERPGRVKGRGHVAFRFSTIDPPGDAERLSIRTDTIARQAAASKKTDAAKIGGGAAGGAIIGASWRQADGAEKGRR